MIKATELTVGYSQAPSGEPVGSPGTIVTGPLSFSYSDGECIMLRGRNGSGKTTLMKTLAGLLPPLSGSYEAGGKTILVPTRIPKVKGFTVKEFVRAGMLTEYGSFRKLDGDAVKAIDDAMGMMELDSLSGKDISMISDGEFQKACIAAALTRKANVLMLDEPTAFLDVENRVMVLQTLQRLAHDTDTTVLFSTHDIHDGTLYSDAVIWI